MKSFEFSALFEDRAGIDDCISIGIINGLSLSSVLKIQETLDDLILNDFDVDCLDEFGAFEVNFIAENVSYCEGQMTFPETGQWDFEPHYEMDLRILSKSEKLN